MRTRIETVGLLLPKMCRRGATRAHLGRAPAPACCVVRIENPCATHITAPPLGHLDKKRSERPVAPLTPPHLYSDLLLP